MLVYLAEHADEVLSKERIIQAVWPDAFVSDQVLINAISALRKAFDGGPDQGEVIQTIPRRGYRLIPEVKKPEPDVSRYQIVKKLGQGAMGEVYLGEDSLLRRKVALKFVSRDKQEDEGFRRRLLREARAAAALDHPFICKIYTVGELEGKDFISMEYVQGQTLKEKLSGSPLSLRDTLEIGVEMAEALEEAHSRDIIHRDLKPANIMLTEQGHVKITDFGLAKWVPLLEGEEQEYTETLSRDVSTEGTIPYMSPEQVTGRKVDPRSDIFSFGVVLYEMLTGVTPFRKTLPMETAAAIQMAEVPPIQEYTEGTPEGLEALLARMLAKEPERRQGSIGEVRESLVELLEEEGRSPVQLPARVIQEPALHVVSPLPVSIRKSVSLLWVLGLIVSAVAVTAAVVWYLKPTAVPGSDTVSLHHEIVLPEGERLVSYYRQAVALSPDGTQLAFVSGTVASPYAIPKTRIYLRRLDQWQARPIPGTEDAAQPFFSPDGNWLGFGNSEGLKKVNLAGGDPVELCKCDASYGASWGPDGTIIFAAGFSGLFRISSSGGKPEEITSLDEGAGEISHRLPHILPNGKAVLFTATRHKYVNLDWKRAQIFAHSLETSERKLLIEGGSDARYIPTGHLVFAREGRLLAVPFDLVRLEVNGPAVPVLDGINHSIYSGHVLRETGVAQFSFPQTGMLAYVPGSVFPERKFTPVWVDRQGREEPLGVDPRTYLAGHVSSDGRQILLNHQYPPRDVWLFDLDRQTLRRQTFEGNHTRAIWGPGPEYFTVDSDREGPVHLYIKKVNSGPGEVERLENASLEWRRASSWSPDGERLAFISTEEGSGFDIKILSREGKVEPFLQTRFWEAWPEFSPDGRWIVYCSNESRRYEPTAGRNEIYVRPYDRGPGTAVQISTQGGLSPAWSRDGQEIFFRRGGAFYSVRVDVAGMRLKADLPVKLFEGLYIGTDPVRSYDVAPDGRFLLMKPPDEAARTALIEEFFPTRIRLVQNWFEELKRLVPTDH